ncbi:hypothetical protein D3C87_970390 [compost metagenome]
MTDIKLEIAGKLAVAALATAAFVMVVRAATPMREINAIIEEVKVDWTDAKMRQSINDKYNAGKIKRIEWLEQMHNGPAKLLWLRLSTAYPDHIHYIVKRIRQEYPHATKWV